MYLSELSKKYIEETQEKAIVTNRKTLLCNLTNAVVKGINLDNSIKSVYITTRCVKHWYDKKPAEEYHFIIKNLHKIVKYPDKIYENKSGKRGNFCFVKKIGGEDYFCSIEVLEKPPCVFGVAQFGFSEFGSDSIIKEIQVATAMRIRKKKYLKNYTLLWDWGNDNPPS